MGAFTIQALSNQETVLNCNMGKGLKSGYARLCCINIFFNPSQVSQLYGSAVISQPNEIQGVCEQ